MHDVVIERCPIASLEPPRTANMVEIVPEVLSDWNFVIVFFVLVIL